MLLCFFLPTDWNNANWCRKTARGDFFVSNCLLIYNDSILQYFWTPHWMNTCQSIQCNSGLPFFFSVQHPAATSYQYSFFYAADTSADAHIVTQLYIYISYSSWCGQIFKLLVQDSNKPHYSSQQHSTVYWLKNQKVSTIQIILKIHSHRSIV